MNLDDEVKLESLPLTEVKASEVLVEPDPIAPDPLSQYKRFFAMRPRGAASDLPQWDPQRDFSQIACWLRTIITFADGNFRGYWLNLMQRIEPTKFSGSDGELLETEEASKLAGEALADAFYAIQEYLVAARGGLPLDMKNPPPGFDFNFREHREVQAGLREVSPAGMVPMLGMLGVCALDMLFFSARQDELLERTGPYTFDQMLPVLNQISLGLMDGKPDNVTAKEALRTAVGMLLASGYGPGNISRIVENVLVEFDKTVR